MNPFNKLTRMVSNRTATIIFFLIGILLGFEIGRDWKDSPPAGLREMREVGEPYEFVNPLLECQGSEKYISRELAGFREKVEGIVEEEIGKGKATEISVYFRDLNNGPWFGVNEDQVFLPGSLLKVPLMMGILKMEETAPAILKRKVAFDQPAPAVYTQYIKPLAELEFGKSYTVEDLIYRMIVYSDNMAAHLLSLIDEGRMVEEIFRDLNVPVPDANKEYQTNVVEYASFFRILFNASYLTAERSNEALKLLIGSQFKEGLVAGVPPNIPVAHKFGERTDESGQKQFHDCGIVYYPEYPYLLCVMAKGEDYGGLVSAIRDISRLAYEEVDRQMSL